MDNFKIIGGVKFNEKDIVSSEKISQDGKEYNSVFLKDGTKIVYPEQNPDNDASVSATHEYYETVWHHGYKTHWSTVEKRIAPTSVIGFNGGTLIGTENKDRYSIIGCENMTIDISQDDSKGDNVKLQARGFLCDQGNQNNTIIHRKEDSIIDGVFGLNKKNEHIEVDD